MPKNEKLSHWSALNTCYCGRWTVQRAPQRSPKGAPCYERDNPDDPALSAKIRTWRVVPGGHEWVGPDKCEVCGYDLTRSPETNLRAISDNEWLAGEIVGSNFSVEGAPADFLPDLPLVFVGCNLDNVILPPKAIAKGCSNKRVAVQNDRNDWVCAWKDGAPVQPIDLGEALRTGRNMDPAKLPKAMLTPDQFAAESAERREWLQRVEASRALVGKGWAACSCVAQSAADASAKLGKAISAPPDRACKACGGLGIVLVGGDG